MWDDYSLESYRRRAYYGFHSDKYGIYPDNSAQQRQIDQLYVVTSSLIQRATPAEQWKFYDYEKLPDGKYKMYFPNYRTNSAVLIYLDPNSPKRREEELIHINTTRIPPNILENWPIGEVHDLPQEE